jgi:alkanesulfonate monooxygenase SsuD/methylene tetrahydromethanopterin reductase-like flavin-dependent oxidoreductase (luciferase family)
MTMKIGMYMATQWPQGADLGQEMANLCEQTRAAKENGFASVLVGQHFLSEPLQMIQAEPLLARLVAEGEGMEFGIAIVLLAMQNPVIVAEYAASLDWITGGKYILGVGVGYRQEEFEGLGVPFEERRSRFEEAIPLIRRLWTEDKVEHRGEHFTVGGLSASIRPKQAGGPPIWVGGEIPPAVRRAARLGCPWVIPPTMHWDDAVHRLGVYKAAMGEAGTSNPHGQPLIREVVIGATREAAMAAAGPHLLAKYESYASWGQTAASEGSLADRFDEFCAKRFIIGDEAEVEDEMARYRDEMGVDHFLVRLQWPGFEQKGVVDAVERIGRVAARLG